MAYVAPAGDAIHLTVSASTGYSAPAGNALHLTVSYEPTVYSAVVQETLSLGSVLKVAFKLRSSDGIAFTDQGTPKLCASVAELLTLAATPGAKLTAHAAVVETLALDDVLGAVWQMLLTDGLALTDTPSVLLRRSVAVADGLVLSSVVASTLTAHALVAEVLALRDLVSPAFGAKTTDTLSLTETVLARAAYHKQLIDTVSVSDVAKNSLRAVRLVQDGVAFEDSVETQATFHALIQDGVSFLATVRIAGAVYDCWVMGTENNKPVTRYTNYNFSSMAEFGGMYFGAASDGLWLMGGETDGLDFIDAWIQLGEQAAAGGALFNIDEAFIGLRSNGEMVLKVVDKEDHVFSYRVVPVSDQKIEETRVSLGRGVVAQYQDMILENVDGADFEIDVISWRPVVMTRRIY